MRKGNTESETFSKRILLDLTFSEISRGLFHAEKTSVDCLVQSICNAPENRQISTDDSKVMRTWNIKRYKDIIYNKGGNKLTGPTRMPKAATIQEFFDQS